MRADCSTPPILLPLGGRSPRKLVLRLGPVNRHLLLDFERNLMPAEQCIYRICAQRGIPASNMLVCDTSRDIIDRDYSFVEYIPSLPLSDERCPHATGPRPIGAPARLPRSSMRSQESGLAAFWKFSRVGAAKADLRF